MNISLEEIVAELKANYGLLRYASCLDPYTFKPKTSLVFKEYVTGPHQLDKLIKPLSNILDEQTKYAVLKDICESLSKQTS